MILLKVLLQSLLGYTIPEYYHHKLITGDNRKRIAKRDNPLTLRQMREDGLTSDVVLSQIERYF